MGSIFIGQNVARVEDTLGAGGVPAGRADEIAHAITSADGGGDAASFADRAGAGARAVFEAVQTDVAESSRTVAGIMPGIMAVAFVVAVVWRPRGRVAETPRADEPAAAQRAVAG